MVKQFVKRKRKRPAKAPKGLKCGTGSKSALTEPGPITIVNYTPRTEDLFAFIHCLRFCVSRFAFSGVELIVKSIKLDKCTERASAFVER